MALRRFTSRVSIRAAPRFAPLAVATRFAAPSSTPVALPVFFNSARCYADAGHGHGGSENPNTTARAQAYLLDRDIVKQRVVDVVKNFEKVDASKVTESSHFINDLGLDSLDVVEVVMALEQEFILDIPDHEAEKLQSIPEVIDYIATNPMAK
eukprot:PhF_6_TR16651/c0_g1_i1/m.25337/K03955/NDUFAB1; NADH dehydrogenase (ubiquinone) 1 alpha/beta subcomplex 1